MPVLSTERLAAIDIGTNSIKLLVADVSTGRVDPVAFRRETPRIGAGLDRSGRVKRENLANAIDVVRRFARIAQHNGAAKTFAFSTYALRVADNAGDVVRLIERRAGIRVRVLSGREEALFSYLSAGANLSLRLPGTLLFDVGGGSIELVLARSGSIERSSSLPLGALVLSERFLRSDPIVPEEYEALRRHATSRLSRWFSSTDLPAPARFDVVASGGTITTLQAMSLPHARSAEVTVSYGDLRRLERRCLALTTAQRSRLRGLPSDRADIIPAGIAVVLEILRLSRKRVLKVNAGGVRDGALIHLHRNRLRW